MIHYLRKHYAAQAAKAKPVVLAQTGENPAAQTASTAATAARHWALPDLSVLASQKPVEPSRTKPETLDRRMVATLAKLAQPLN